VSVFSHVCFLLFAGVRGHLKGHLRRQWSVLRACHHTGASPTGHTQNHTDLQTDKQALFMYGHTTPDTHKQKGTHNKEQILACTAVTSKPLTQTDKHRSFTLASFPLATTSHLRTNVHASTHSLTEHTKSTAFGCCLSVLNLGLRESRGLQRFNQLIFPMDKWQETTDVLFRTQI